MNKLASFWQHTTDKWWKRVLATLIIAAVIVFAFGYGSEGIYQFKLQKLSNAVNDIGHTSVEPLGGVVLHTYTKAPHFVDSLLCIDNGPCPEVTRSWAMLVDVKQEKYLIHQILQEAGYQDILDNTSGPGASAGGAKDGIALNASFYPLESNPPYQAPVGKEWRSFDVSVH